MRDIEHSDIADLLNDDFLGNDLDAFISELECGDEAMAPADGAPLVDGISLVPSEAAQCGATHRVSSSPPPTSIAQPPTGAILERGATTVAEALLMPLLVQLGSVAPPPPSRREAKAARAYRAAAGRKAALGQERNHTHYGPTQRREAAHARRRSLQKKHTARGCRSTSAARRIPRSRCRRRRRRACRRRRRSRRSPCPPPLSSPCRRHTSPCRPAPIARSNSAFPSYRGAAAGADRCAILRCRLMGEQRVAWLRGRSYCRSAAAARAAAPAMLGAAPQPFKAQRFDDADDQQLAATPLYLSA